MTDEEKKAIEYYKKFVNLILSWNGMEETEMYKNLQIVLNLVEKLQQEIEEADEIIDNSIETQNEREKYTHSLEEKLENQKVTLELYCKNCGLQKDKIEKLEKVIDEIYNLFYEFINRCPGSGMRLLQENGFDTTKCDENKCDNKNCKECIKQYFYRKVEKNYENND